MIKKKIRSRSRQIFVVLLFSLIALPLHPVKAATPDISFTGSGWGHGVGLSQYGAKAMGADSVDSERIIQRYFPGVQIVPVPDVIAGTFLSNDQKPVLVNLIKNSSSVAFFVETGKAELCFDDSAFCLAEANPGQTFRFVSDGIGGCLFMLEVSGSSPKSIGSSRSCNGSVRPLSDETLLRIPFKARSYRKGDIKFKPAPENKIHTVFETDIENYLKGISEVPESWPYETIKAQVIVSRSYTTRMLLERGNKFSLSEDRKNECYCNFNDDKTDQIFRGWTGETRNKNWVRAVNDTANQVMGYRGTVALGMYSSSSGGRTESYEDAFGTNEHPYLVSVDDSPAFSSLAGNPHRTWKASYDSSALAKIFDFSVISNLEVTGRNSSGSVKEVKIEGIKQGKPHTETYTGSEIRSLLSLRSTTFDISIKQKFIDVSPENVFAAEIMQLFELGITNGCDANNYCPEEAITRGEMAAMLTRAFDLPQDPEAEPYEDDDGNFFEVEIETLYVNGVTKGCSINLFCPEAKVTRAEMAAFISRLLKLSNVPSQNYFNDIEGHALSAEIEALATSGITKGCTTSTFCPDRFITRGEMSAFIVRALNY